MQDDNDIIANRHLLFLEEILTLHQFRILRMKFSKTLLIASCTGVAMALQIIWGNIDLALFAFPVNIALLAILVGGTYVLYQEKKESASFQKWSDTSTSVLLLVIIGICCLLIAFVPSWKVQQAWPFNVLMLLLLNQLLITIFRYKGPYRFRFHLNHIGLLLLVASLTFGAADMHRWKAMVCVGDSIQTAYDYKGIPHALGYELKLKDFEVKYYDNGTPQHFDAEIEVDGETQHLLVNYPWQKSWKEDIYITNYGTMKENAQTYCIIEFITQPWKHVTTAGLLLTALGASLLLWGKKSKNSKA